MNKLFISTLSIVALCSSFSVYAATCQPVTDNALCEKTTLPTLQAKNNATLDMTTITGIVSVGDNLSATNATMMGAVSVGSNLSATNTTIQSLQVAKNASLTNTVVMAGTTIGGNLATLNTTADSLLVQGNTSLKNTTVSTKSTYNGNLMADSSKLADTMAASNRVNLSATTVTSITLKSTNALVCLDKKSAVNTIHFTKGNGKIYLTDSLSHVVKVTGGQIIQGDCPMAS